MVKSIQSEELEKGEEDQIYSNRKLSRSKSNNPNRQNRRKSVSVLVKIKKRLKAKTKPKLDQEIRVE